MVHQDIITEESEKIIDLETSISQIIKYVGNYLENYYSGEDLNKWLYFYSTLGALYNNHQTLIITGKNPRLRNEFAIMMLELFPEDIVEKFYGKGITSFSELNLKGKKILFISDFEGNRNLIKIITAIKTKVNLQTAKGKVEIPKITVITTTSQSKLSRDVGLSKTSIKFELSDMVSESELRSYSILEESSKIIDPSDDKDLNAIKKFILSCQWDVKIKIPYIEKLRSYFYHYLPDSDSYHYNFIQILKNITFFNQVERITYTLYNENKEIVEKGFLASPVDLEKVMDIGEYAFIKISQNLDKQLFNLLYFALRWVEDDISIAKIKDEVEYSRNDGDFPGKYVIDDYITYLKSRNEKDKELDKDEIKIYSSKTYDRLLERLVALNYLTKFRSDKNYYTFISAPPIKMINYEKDKEVLKSEVDDYIKKNKKTHGDKIEFLTVEV